MKKIILSAMMILLAMGITLIGCYKDIILPDAAFDPDGPPQAVSFSKDIAPLVSSKCALSGCHVSGGHAPNMALGSAYVAMVNGGFVNTDIPKQSIIYKMINGEMQQYIPSAADRQKIYDWIRNGAPNN
jgi:hypothetical protein